MTTMGTPNKKSSRQKPSRPLPRRPFSLKLGQRGFWEGPALPTEPSPL